MNPYKKEIACAGCGVVFETYKKNSKKYCNPKCYHDHTVPWCKGLSKETDDRLMVAAEKIKLNHHDVSGSKNPMYGRIASLAPKWNPNREEVARNNKVAHLCGRLLNRAIKFTGTKKTARTNEMLGFTKDEFKKNLESKFLEGMSWNNHGNGPGKWHVDHIRPVASFPKDTPLSEINNLNNLQPLWSQDNHKKWKKWEG